MVIFEHFHHPSDAIHDYFDVGQSPLSLFSSSAAGKQLALALYSFMFSLLIIAMATCFKYLLISLLRKALKHKLSGTS